MLSQIIEEENYHEIEKILTDFKNGATYSDSIEKIQKLSLSRLIAEIIKMAEEMKFEMNVYADFLAYKNKRRN